MNNSMKGLIRFVLSCVDEDSKREMNEYLNGIDEAKYESFTDISQINNFIGDNSLSEAELLDLRSYTGYNFKCINAILRNTWTYEENGLLNEEVKNKYLTLANNISNIISNASGLNTEFKAYRGTNVNAFKDYGINSIQELAALKGEFMYEKGFTSTSLIENNSYFNQQLETGINYNVKIIYLIDGNYSGDGILMGNEAMSYSPNQTEFILGNGALSKVSEVMIDEQEQTATIIACLVPKNIWNKQVSQMITK